MSKLNYDIILLILEKLQNVKHFRKSLYSCLMVNRTWCEATGPMLWENPCPADNTKMIKLAKVIFLHLSEESREILKNKEINLFTETSQRPLFNYISFWKYLNLHSLEKIFASITTVKSKVTMIRSEILKLFIRNTKFTHVYININTSRFSYHQLHLIPGAEHCWSELKFLQCNSKDSNFLEGFAGISKSIKKFDFYALSSNITGIINLMEVQKHLNDVQFRPSRMIDERSHKTLEESLIKHANTVQHLQIYWKPVTEFLSCLVNLIGLEINISHGNHDELNSLDWSHLKNVSLPGLKILKTLGVPSKSLASLIESTKGHLNEISVDYGYDDYKGLIQAISQNCPNLVHIKLCLENSNISEFEDLLNNCRCLSGLVIYANQKDEEYNWDNLFEVLARSSPNGFDVYWKLKSESFKLFFESWRGRHPMLLQTVLVGSYGTIELCFDLIEKYKVEGIIKKYDDHLWARYFEDFEWIKKKI